MIDKTLFHLRYKLAAFLVAGDIFDNIISKPNFADLSSLSLIQHDRGFYLAAFRIVETLTQVDTRTEQDAELFKQKVLDGKTIYFLKGPLEGASTVNLREKLEAAKTTEELVATKLFDTLVLKEIYDTYFMAYAVSDFTYEFLDDSVGQLANSSIPVNAFNMFSAKTLELVEGLFDMDDNKATRKVINMLKKHEYMSSYVQFLALAERFALVKKTK